MNTPDFSVPNPCPQDLVAALQAEKLRQQEATPELDLPITSSEQSYKWMCELEHNRFSSQEVECYRSDIFEPGYWEQEARHFKKELSELIWAHLVESHTVDGKTSTVGWRDIANAYVRRLKRNGLSISNIRESRCSIVNEEYWKPEAERLRQIAALREYNKQQEYLDRQKPGNQSEESSLLKHLSTKRQPLSHRHRKSKFNRASQPRTGGIQRRYELRSDIGRRKLGAK